MSAQAKRKVGEEPFTYSWYLPVAGGKGSSGTQAAVLLENEAEPEIQGQEMVEPGSEQAKALSQPEAAAVEQTGGPAHKVTPTNLRLIALSSWSAVSGVGMALLVTQSPVHVNNVLALVGVWAALSGLIWYLPGKLMK